MSQQSQGNLEVLRRVPAALSVPEPAEVQALSVAPTQVMRLLLCITGVLVGIHILTQLAIVAFSSFVGRNWLVSMFDLGGEANLPATFSGALLLLSSLLLGMIALQKRRTGAPFTLLWTLLSAVFLFLSLDELASIHDNISSPMAQVYKTDGALMYGWVIPYGLAVGALLLVSVRFLLHLPPRTRNLFLLSGVLYVGAALGIELTQAYTNSLALETGPLAFMSVTLEEAMEMLGVVVFIYALLSYIEKHLPGFAVQLRIKSEAGRPDR